MTKFRIVSASLAMFILQAGLPAWAENFVDIPCAIPEAARSKIANAGALDSVDRKKVRAWEEQFLSFMKEQMPEVRALLAKEKKISPEVEAGLKKAIETFQPQFKG